MSDQESESTRSEQLARLAERVAELEGQLAEAKLGCFLKPYLDTMFEGIQILDRDWRYVHLNLTAAAQGRAAREELVGRRIFEVFHNFENTAAFAVMKFCMEERVPRQLLNHFEYPDGRDGWFDLRIYPIEPGILVLSVDVTDRLRTERALQRNREHLAAVLACMAEGVVTTDVYGRIDDMNPAAESMTGWLNAEAKGKLVGELVQLRVDRTGESIESPLESILERGLQLEMCNGTSLLPRLGEPIPVATSGRALRDEVGSLLGTVIVLKDMREEYKLIQRLQHAQKMEALGRFAGGVAHDFNNLLTVITGYTEMLLPHTNLPLDVAECLREVAGAGRRGSELTRQLLSFSRRRPLQFESVNPTACIRELEPMLRRLLGAQVELVVRLDEGLRPVRLHAGALDQVLLNLIMNGRDAMPDGGKLVLEARQVFVDEAQVALHVGASVGPHLAVSVADSGMGIDENVREHLFEPYFTTKEQGEGTGLGLATVHGIVQQSGGHVSVVSEVGHGTTFTIYLPNAELASASISAPLRTTTRPERTGAVLVVEDDDGVLAFLTRTLHRAGYRVAGAHDGIEAMAALRGLAEPPRLLLADVLLPGEGGVAVAKRIQAAAPNVRVLFMSGYPGEGVDRRGRGRRIPPGFVCLEKPLLPTTLLEAVAEALEPRARSRL